MATRLRCYGCNEVGHIRENCPYGESVPRCSFCNKFGHTKVTCWHYLDKTRNDFEDGKGGVFANVVESNKRDKFLDYTCIEVGLRTRWVDFKFDQLFWENGQSIIVNFAGSGFELSYQGIDGKISEFARMHWGILRDDWYNIMGVGRHFSIDNMGPGSAITSDCDFGKIYHMWLPEVGSGKDEFREKEIRKCVAEMTANVIDYARYQGYKQIWFPLNQVGDPNVKGWNEECMKNAVGWVNESVLGTIERFHESLLGDQLLIRVNRPKESVQEERSEVAKSDVAPRTEERKTNPGKEGQSQTEPNAVSELVLTATPRKKLDWEEKCKVISEDLAANNPKFVLCGDSIIARLKNTKVIARQKDGESDMVLAGIAGEKVENLLYRIQDTTWPESVRIVFLAIGTNNLFSNSIETIVQGISACEELIKHQKPGIRVIVQGILPRMFIRPNLVQKIKRINEILKDKFREDFVDFEEKFMDKEGVPIASYYEPDGLHASKKGGEMLIKAIETVLKQKGKQTPGRNATVDDCGLKDVAYSVDFDRTSMTMGARVGTVQVEVLIDTGSCVTLIAEHVVRKLGDVWIGKPTTKKIMGINNAVKPCMGEVEVELELGDKVLAVKANILRDMRYDIVMGRETFNKHLAVMDYEKAKLWFNRETGDEIDTECGCFLTKDVILEPGSKAVVNVRLSPSTGRKGEIKASNECLDLGVLVSGKELNGGGNGMCEIRNITSKRIKLKRNLLVASFGGSRIGEVSVVCASEEEIVEQGLIENKENTSTGKNMEASNLEKDIGLTEGQEGEVNIEVGDLGGDADKGNQEEEVVNEEEGEREDSANIYKYMEQRKRELREELGEDTVAGKLIRVL